MPATTDNTANDESLSPSRMTYSIMNVLKLGGGSSSPPIARDLCRAGDTAKQQD